MTFLGCQFLATKQMGKAVLIQPRLPPRLPLGSPSPTPASQSQVVRAIGVAPHFFLRPWRLRQSVQHTHLGPTGPKCQWLLTWDQLGILGGFKMVQEVGMVAAAVLSKAWIIIKKWTINHVEASVSVSLSQWLTAPLSTSQRSLNMYRLAAELNWFGRNWTVHVDQWEWLGKCPCTVSQYPYWAAEVHCQSGLPLLPAAPLRYGKK